MLKSQAYASYLRIDELLSIQKPKSDGPEGSEHNEWIIRAQF